MIKIGSDFELPLIDTDNHPVSVEGRLGGTKHDPIDIGEGCQKQEDNVMAEFNIPATSNFEEFKQSIEYCINLGNKELSPLRLAKKSSYHYSANEVATEQGATFGCEPSFCAYEWDIRDNEAEPTTLRSAGFHLHFDCPEEEIQDRVIKLDKHLGILSLLLDPDKERRNLYGKAGDFRITDYGFEYRVLGSGMLRYLDVVWEQAIKAMTDASVLSKDDIKEIKRVMDEQDVITAKTLFPNFNIAIYA